MSDSNPTETSQIMDKHQALMFDAHILSHALQQQSANGCALLLLAHAEENAVLDTTSLIAQLPEPDYGHRRIIALPFHALQSDIAAEAPLQTLANALLFGLPALKAQARLQATDLYYLLQQHPAAAVLLLKTVVGQMQDILPGHFAKTDDMDDTRQLLLHITALEGIFSPRVSEQQRGQFIERLLELAETGWIQIIAEIDIAALNVMQQYPMLMELLYEHGIYTLESEGLKPLAAADVSVASTATPTTTSKTKKSTTKTSPVPEIDIEPLTPHPLLQAFSMLLLLMLVGAAVFVTLQFSEQILDYEPGKSSPSLWPHDESSNNASLIAQTAEADSKPVAMMQTPAQPSKQAETPAPVKIVATPVKTESIQAKPQPAPVVSNNDLSTLEAQAELWRKKDPEEALKAYQKALDAGLNIKAPDAQIQRRLSVLHDRMGLLLQQQQKIEAAKTQFLKALQVSRQLYEQNPEAFQWQRDLAISHERLGDLYHSNKESDAAQAAYQQAIVYYKQALESKPDLKQQNALAYAYDRLGDSQRSSDTRAALATYQQALSLRQKITQRQNNQAAQQALAISYQKIQQLWNK
ncbi:hypothetical protein [Candidatus Venteria ishoeyi]|uniref:Photosystem I assembly protein Ycf3 n=1 Tax=Candidatus Venteria ishoeyi TaxID=1899563 RepID=A0A1H6F9L5_9GAMM|nr:hypothetical protein [Candidatus Venteria ishoeyi]SEH06800.1 Photosystem I assembly protein Ycf3 [Candidatus Venteria ishoeyi]